MANIVQTEANNLLNGWLGIAAYTAATTPMKLAISSTTTSATSAGTEATGNGYARQTITFSAPTAAVTSNSAQVSFTNMPAGTWTDINVYDNAGNRRAYGTLNASKTTASGDTLSFAASAISISLS